MNTRAGAISFFFSASLLAGCIAPPSVGEHDEATTFPNDKPAFDFFVAQGLADYQAAGIVGNLDVESGVDPKAVQGGGPGRGIAQWSKGARWDTTYHDNNAWYAGTIGQGSLTLDAQLQFIWYELTHYSTYGLAQLKASTTTSGATIAFMTHFEVCGSCASSKRVTYAKAALAAYGGDLPDMAGVHHDFGQACVLETGETGICIDSDACNGFGDHTSVPGYCPGGANIQCCVTTTAADGAMYTPIDLATTDAASTMTTGTETDTDGGDAAAKKGGCSTAGGSVDGLAAVLLALVVMRRRRLTIA